MHRRSPRAFAPTWLRSLTRSSFALGGLLMAAPALAAEAREAPATIVDVSMRDGELTARIRWSAESKSLPEEVEVLSYDGTDTLTAGERVAPKAGEELEVRLSGAVQEPWETGWAQRLVVREAKGRELASQPYDVSLACEDEKTCQLTAAPGISASREVVHVSTALRKTLASIEKELGTKQFDLVREVAQREPSLFGEALSYAQGLVKYSPAEGCDCVWETSFSRTNTSGTTLGAAHELYSRPLRNRASNARLSAQGTSRVTLSLRCGTLSSPRLQPVGIRQSDGRVRSVLLPQPVYSTCVGPCSGRFNHYGRITGSVEAYSSGPLLNGTAQEQSTYHLGDALSPVVEKSIFAPTHDSFDEPSVVNNVGSGTSYVQTSGEAFHAFGGNTPDSTQWPYGHVRNGYAMAVQGSVVCPIPSGTLYPIGRAWDTATTQDNQGSLTQGIWDFFGL